MRDIKGQWLTDEYVYLRETPQSSLPRDRVFLAKGGFGCDPEALGTKVFGIWVRPGGVTEEMWVRRYDVLGILDGAEAGACLNDNRDPMPLEVPDPHIDRVQRDAAMQACLELVVELGYGEYQNFNTTQLLSLMTAAYQKGVTDGE